MKTQFKDKSRAFHQTGDSEDESFVGRVIKGNFKVEQELGVGAMGKVFLAEQISLSKKVAIKVLHSHLKRDKNLALRFHREAKAASTLNHPNSISIIDFGEDEDGVLYIAMEYLDGEDLGQVLEREFPLPLRRTVKILGQVCQALDEAHHNNIVHRDLKPENIMIVPRRDEPDFVKVCDFGIAKVQDPHDEGEVTALTMAGMICGTPQYMSPEQAEGKKLDGRSDIYSLGVILYEMVTGQIPFMGDTPLSIVTKHLNTSPTPPRELRPDLEIHPVLEAFVLRTISKDPKARPQSAMELKLGLEQVLDVVEGRATSAELALPEVDEEAAGPTAPVTVPAQRAQKPKKKGIWVAIGVAAILAAGLGVAGYALLRADESTNADGPERLARGRVLPPASDGSSAARPDGSAPSVGREERDATAADSSSPPAPGDRNVANRKPTTARRAGRRRRRRSRRSPPRRETSARPDRQEARKPQEPRNGAREARPDSFDELFKQGYADFSASRYSAALKKFRKARRLRPGSAKIYKYMGKCYMRRNQIGRAVRMFKRYLRLAPSAGDAWVYRGIVKKHTRPRPSRESSR